MLTNKKIIFLAFLILQHFGSTAQRFRALLSAGFVASDVYGADIVVDSDAWNDTDFRKAGVMLGVGVNTALGKRTLVQMETNYIQKGTQQRGDSTGYGFYKFAFNYVEVPVLLNYRLQFHVGRKKVKGFDVHGGISAGRLIKSKAEGNNFYTVNNYSYFNRTDISLLTGIGYNFSDHLRFSFRYSNSLIPVFKRDNSPIFFAQSANVGNSIVLHFILHYVFGAGKPTVENSN
jgi:hypothetical protein